VCRPSSITGRQTKIAIDGGFCFNRAIDAASRRSGTSPFLHLIASDLIVPGKSGRNVKVRTVARIVAWHCLVRAKCGFMQVSFLFLSRVELRKKKSAERTMKIARILSLEGEPDRTVPSGNFNNFAAFGVPKFNVILCFQRDI